MLRGPRLALWPRASSRVAFVPEGEARPGPVSGHVLCNGIFRRRNPDRLRGERHEVGGIVWHGHASVSDKTGMTSERRWQGYFSEFWLWDGRMARLPPCFESTNQASLRWAPPFEWRPLSHPIKGSRPPAEKSAVSKPGLVRPPGIGRKIGHVGNSGKILACMNGRFSPPRFPAGGGRNFRSGGPDSS